MQTTDIAVVGAGIVGAATAHAVRMIAPSLSVTVLDKEPAAARHQSGRNSGVIHSGLYYRPGSLKAETCRAGRRRLIEYCRANELPFEICGKVVVATDEAERSRLPTLLARGVANGTGCRELNRGELREIEPHVAGVAALSVPDTGIVDYRLVTKRLLEDVRSGGLLIFNAAVRGIEVSGNRVRLETAAGPVEASVVVNCAGLYCDRLYRLAGGRRDVQIVPFRGEYYEVTGRSRSLCRNLIYPVPDPAFPFLGVHLTRMIDGTLECGPNAVLALSREGYRPRDVSLRDAFETFAFRGFRRLAGRHTRMGLAEMRRSLSREAFAHAVRRLVPELRTGDLEPAAAGVRAQAVAGNGSLVDDFLIEDTERCVHVLNAPSPAATASLEIGRQVAERALRVYRANHSRPLGVPHEA